MSTITGVWCCCRYDNIYSSGGCGCFVQGCFFCFVVSTHSVATLQCCYPSMLLRPPSVMAVNLLNSACWAHKFTETQINLEFGWGTGERLTYGANITSGSCRCMFHMLSVVMWHIQYFLFLRIFDPHLIFSSIWNVSRFYSCERNYWKVWKTLLFTYHSN